MFIGFIPVLSALAATITSMADERAGRSLWVLTMVLVAAWSAYHASHHWASLSTYGSW